MNGTGFLTACIVAFAGVSASLAPFAERAKNQDTKKPGRAWRATGLFCTALTRSLRFHAEQTLSSRRNNAALPQIVKPQFIV